MKSQVKLLYELSFLCSHLSNNIRTFVIAPIILGERKEITCFVYIILVCIQAWTCYLIPKRKKMNIMRLYKFSYRIKLRKLLQYYVKKRTTTFACSSGGLRQLCMLNIYSMHSGFIWPIR